MIIKSYQTGVLDVNTYALLDEKSKNAILIDVGGNITQITEDLKKENYKINYILNTHGHFDHIYGEKEAQDLYNLPVYIHKNDVILINNLKEQLSMWGFPQVEPPNITETFEDNDEFTLGNIKIKVLHTPGHTPGGVGFFCTDEGQNVLFSGDSLFYHSIGRTDLPLGNHTDLINSVKAKFLSLPDDTRVLPGHDMETSIKDEKLYNEFLK